MLSLKRSFVVAVLGFVAFVTSFGAHVVAVNLPVYAKQVGVGLMAIGLLIAVYDFAEIFAKPVFGWIADRRGIKTTMLVGIAFFSLASLSYLFVTPRLLILVRFLQGLGAAAFSITVHVDARALRVIDKDASEKERVQKTMLGPEVLDSERHQEIVFKTTGAEATGQGMWTPRGNLTLHGQTQPVTVQVTLNEDRYIGATTMKLTDFGIKPPGKAGVRTKDEVRIEFDVRLASQERVARPLFANIRVAERFVDRRVRRTEHFLRVSAPVFQRRSVGMTLRGADSQLRGGVPITS